MNKLKLKKGDKIQVITGRDKGREGTITRVFPQDRTVVVPGLNQYKKHVKKQKDRPGEIATLDRPIAISKIALVCPKCKQPTRVGYSIQGDTKQRLCRKCDNLIDSTKAPTKTKEVTKVKKVTTKK